MTERVDVLINRVMKAFPGVSSLAQSRYYEEVHQELAPLAREIERQRDELLTKHQVACDTIERQRADIDAIRGYMDALKKSCERIAQQRDELLAALEMARNGIAWYIENAPEASGCDDEALQQIDAAIAKVKP